MECIVQYLDDLEDLLFAGALLAERARRVLRAFFIGLLVLALLSGAVLLAFAKPPLAIAAASLLTVAMLYRAAVHHPRRAELRSATRPLS